MRNQCNYIWKIRGWSWESCQTCVQIASFDSPHLVSYKNHQLPPTKHTYTREMINMKYMTHLCLFKVSKMFEILSNLQDCDMTQSTHCVKRPQIKINVAWLPQKALKFWSSSVQRTSALWCVCRSPPPPHSPSPWLWQRVVPFYGPSSSKRPSEMRVQDQNQQLSAFSHSQFALPGEGTEERLSLSLLFFSLSWRVC